MKGLVYDGQQTSLQDDLPTPVPARDEVLVKVHLAGICRTDLEIIRGYMDFTGVMGHEFVGSVAEGPRPWLNKRVVAEINNPCGQCEYCKAGLGNHCPHRTVMGIAGRDGCFAEYLTVPAGNLHAVPDGVSDEAAVFAEPLAAAMQIAEQIDLHEHCPEGEALVLGDGRLGLLAAMVMRVELHNVLLVGKHEDKLQLAAGNEVRTQTVGDYQPRKQFPLVVEATGTPEGFDLALRSVRPRGTIILKSTFEAESGMNLAPVVVDEVTVVGSRCGPFDKALKTLFVGRIEPARLISKRFALEDGLAALQAAQDSSNVKVILDVHPSE